MSLRGGRKAEGAFRHTGNLTGKQAGTFRTLLFLFRLPGPLMHRGTGPCSQFIFQVVDVSSQEAVMLWLQQDWPGDLSL